MKKFKFTMVSMGAFTLNGEIESFSSILAIQTLETTYGLHCVKEIEEIVPESELKKWIFTFNVGYGEEVSICYAETLDEAFKIAEDEAGVEAVNNMDIEVIAWTKELARDYELGDE